MKTDSSLAVPKLEVVRSTLLTETRGKIYREEVESKQGNYLIDNGLSSCVILAVCDFFVLRF